MNYHLNCVICKKIIEPDRDKDGHIYWHGGHNPAPIHDSGYCCERCNREIVTPTRLAEIKLQLYNKRGDNGKSTK